MEAKGGWFLKITSIIMIIGAVIGFIISIFAFMGIAILVANGASGTLLATAAFLILMGNVISLIAGIMGIKHSKNPEKADRLLAMGGLIILMVILGQFLNVTGGRGFLIFELAIGLILPGLYMFGAWRNKIG